MSEYPGTRGKFSFLMQIGLTREQVNVEGAMSLAGLKDVACAFVDRKFPEHGLYNLVDKILLFRHDLNSSNILSIVTKEDDVTEGCLIEVVLSGAGSDSPRRVPLGMLHRVMLKESWRVKNSSCDNTLILV